VRVLRGPARFAIAGLAFVAILFLFVFPTRSFWAQRQQIAGARHDLMVLREQNARLAKEAARLDTDAEIERIAREQYHMVHPGERAFAVVPAPPSTTTTAP
jgi:cell division protein FtsB